MTNKLSRIVSIGETFPQNGWFLALTKMEDGTEAYIFKKTKEEIDTLREVKDEVSYATSKASKEGSKTLMTIYLSEEEKKEKPVEKAKQGYAETATAKKNAYYEGKELYWLKREEREVERQEINDKIFERRHFENLLAPFYLELLKSTLDKISDDERGEYTKAVVDSMLLKADELFKNSLNG